MKKKTLNAGFTILEVMIATMIFTVVLLLCMQAVTRIGYLYYKGVTSAQIQDLTRQLSDEFAQQIQFGSKPPFPDTIQGGNPSTPLIFCVGDNRYRAVMNRAMGGYGGTVTTVLQRTSLGGAGTCNTSDTGFSGATELAPRGMRILKLNIIKNPSANVWSVDIRLALGAGTNAEDDSQIFDNIGDTNYSNATCKTQVAGAQFCSVAELRTTLLRRINVE